MRCVKFGTITTIANATVNISDLGFTDPSEYCVILNGNTHPSGLGAVYLSAMLKTKTATAFSVETGNIDDIGVSYQVIANRELT